MIFNGYGFEAEWFSNGFNRGNVPELQQALGLKHADAKGKKYPLFPPILYPGLCSNKKSNVFLAPALINVCGQLINQKQGMLTTLVGFKGTLLWSLIAWRQEEEIRPQTPRSSVGPS